MSYLPMADYEALKIGKRVNLSQTGRQVVVSGESPLVKKAETEDEGVVEKLPVPERVKATLPDRAVEGVLTSKTLSKKKAIACLTVKTEKGSETLYFPVR